MNAAPDISPLPTTEDEIPVDGEGASVAALKAAALADLARARAVAMRFIERLDKRAAGEMTEAEEKSFARVGDDCIAFARMGRALRQIIALEFETVGLREAPARRGHAFADRHGANQNDALGENLSPERERGAGYDLHDPDDNDDYADSIENPAQRRRWIEATLMARVKKVCAAIDIDLRAAGMEAETQLPPNIDKIRRLSLTIPHPALDACVRGMKPGHVAVLYGPDLFPQLGLGPPPDDLAAAWEMFRQKQKRV